MMLRALTLLSLIALSAPAVADELACSGPLGKDATLADIEAAYGKANVVTGEVPGPEGTTLIATTVFGDDADKSFTVYWWDEDKHEHLSGFTVPAKDSAPGGVKLGMGIADVEALNGEPFTLSGFFWDYGGSAGFDSGKLSGLPGGCVLNLQFSPSLDPLPEALSNAISGDRELRSDMKDVRAAKPVVAAITAGYPAPEDMAD